MTENRDQMSPKQLEMEEKQINLLKVFTKSKSRNVRLNRNNKQDKTSQKAEFSCEQCKITLSSEKYFNRHLRTRHPARLKNFTCDFDGKQFRLKNCMRIHMERHRTADFFTCEVCQKSYVCKITFKRHLRTHIDKFPCDLCDSTFKNKNIFDRHRISVHEKGTLEFPCKLCTRVFPSSVLRSNHHYLAHKNNKLNLFRCHECDIDFEMKEELRVHSFIHFNGKIHTCAECHQIFKKKSLLKVHMQKHDGEKLNVCEDCGEKFVYKTGLEKHLRKNRCKGPIYKIIEEMNANEVEKIARNQLEILLNKKVESNTRSINQSDSKASEQEVTVMLEDCEATYEWLSSEDESDIELCRNKEVSSANYSFRRSRTHFEYICDFCGSPVKYKKAMVKHMKEHIDARNKYKCEHCTNAFPSRKKLKDHYIVSHGLKVESVTSKYVCEIDGRTFDTLCFYKTHLLIHSERNRNFICQHCSAAFKTVGNLRRHEATHADSRDFACSQCSKTFKTKLALKIHKDTIHVDPKVFVKCKICGTILQEKHLKTHLKNQHSQNAKEKRFQCGVCAREFKAEYIAKRHYKTAHETPPSVEYVCSECPDKKFASSQDLRDHSFVHFTGEVFMCDCGKRFKTKRCLVRHKQTHAGDVFPCGICENINYKTKGGLRKHNKRCHGLTS